MGRGNFEGNGIEGEGHDEFRRVPTRNARDIRCRKFMLPEKWIKNKIKIKIRLLECGPMLNVMAALRTVSGALCSTSPQSLADAHYQSAVQ